MTETPAAPPGGWSGLFWPLLVAALGAALTPIWAVDLPPLGDYGAHLEQMDIAARYGDPETVYAEVYALPDSWVHPNAISLVAAKLFGPWLGVELLGKLLLSWYVIALPLGLLAICRAFGRSPWLAFFGVPMTFNTILNAGFLNYLIAFPLLLFAIALGRTFAERGGWRLGACLAALLVACFFGHIIVYLIALGIVLALIAVFANRLRDLSRALVVAPSLPLVGDWIGRMVVDPVATESGRQFADESGLGLVFRPFLELANDFGNWGLRFFRDRTDNIVEGVLLALWLGLIVAGLARLYRARRSAFRAEPNASRWSWVRRHSLELITICCLVAYFALPSHLAEVEVITERVVLLVLVLGAAWPRITPVGRLVPGLIGVLVAVSVAYPLVVRSKFVRFEREIVGGLRGAIADLPDRSALYFMKWWSLNPITYMGPTWHLPKLLHAVENGGWTDDSFAMRPTSPIQYRPGRTPPRVGPELTTDPTLAGYQFLLVRTEVAPASLLGVERVTLRWHEGGWWLFDVNPEAFGAH